ncbi:MAG: hypothetical protein GX422_12835, partial [Deltaproteobacteria bacterium]|nr:hypothetical protein [Deltaproteobacteria bacterium]
ARKAGFNPDEALVIARSAQMVDENARGVVDDKIVRMAGETGDYTATFKTLPSFAGVSDVEFT